MQDIQGEEKAQPDSKLTQNQPYPSKESPSTGKHSLTFNQSNKFPLLPPPQNKVLETVCFNCSLGETPLTKGEFFGIVQKLYDNPEMAEKNVAFILRSLADLFSKDRNLQSFMVDEMGFDPELRIFKHSAPTDPVTCENDIADSSNPNPAPDKELEIGVVTLKDFLTKFGKAEELLEENFEQLLQMNNANQYLFPTHEKKSLLVEPTDQKTLISPPSSQEAKENYKLQAKDMLMEFERTYYQKGLHELISSSQLGLLPINQDLSQEHQPANSQNLDFSLQANERLDSNQILISPFPSHQIKQNKDLLSTGIFSYLPNINSMSESKPVRKSQFTSFKNINQNSEPQKQKSLFAENNQGFFEMRRTSVLSNNNSLMHTPQGGNKLLSQLHHYNSEQKPAVQKVLFPQSQAKSMFDSPFVGMSNNSQSNHPNQSPQQRVSENSQHEQKEAISVAVPQIYSYQTPIGKRNFALTGSTLSELHQKEWSMTSPPHHLKRQKTGFTSFKPTKIQSSDSEEEDSSSSQIDQEELKDSVSRKKRGLKILSVKVQELVYKKQKTTYKDVANELIDSLRKNNEMSDLVSFKEELSDNCEEEEEDSSYDMATPSRKAKGTDKKMQLQKWEKNVRRRVYDALNVLYASGVLKKEGKLVFCDPKAKDIFESRLKENNRLNEKQKKNELQDSKVLQQLQILKQEINSKKQNILIKQQHLAEQIKHILCYKQLISRNQQLGEKFKANNKGKIIPLPYILVSTKDSPDNEVDITYGEGNHTLHIAMKKPLKVFGDTDILMQLGFYRVPYDFFCANLPQSSEILSVLAQEQLGEILIQPSDSRQLA